MGRFEFENLLNLKRSSRSLRQAASERKNQVLHELAETLLKEKTSILTANALDIAELSADTKSSFRDRLTLNESRILSMSESISQVARLPDPVGEIVEQRVLSNGLITQRVRAPLGLIFMIFESRPNVICEAFSLAFKSGNAILLRGGSESKNTAKTLYGLIDSVLKKNSFAEPPCLGLDNYDRELVLQLLQKNDLIDVVVPRGGEKLIQHVQNNSLIPIIKNDRGLCHIFINEDADLNMASAIVINAKTQRPGVCNSVETVLVHRNLASQLIPKLYEATSPLNLEWRADTSSLKILKGSAGANLEKIVPASAEDWNTEHLDLILNCRVVESFDEALDHIHRFGSKHSEAIVTASEPVARKFQSEVDAAVVYWNASTRFTDGFELGLGGELGISTQKLHVRGPVGLKELTTARWIIDGQGQIRS
jgi:glutamate-5-semialdehyde dehydrogenase